MIMSSPRRYFDELAARLGPAGSDDLPVWRDDLQHHAAGCYSAHSGIKQWVRRTQAALLSAERWAAVGSVTHGLAYPRAELGHAWKQLLFNQFHDILPGSAIEPAYDDARDQLGEAVAIAKRIITRVQNVIARDVAVPAEEGTQPVLVFNPHPWPVTTDIELQYGVQPTGVHVVDAEGRVTPSQRTQSVATTDDKGRGAAVFRAELPALGYRLYRLRPGAAPAAAAWSSGAPGLLRATETVLENDVLRVELDPATGWLAGLVAKRTGTDLVAGATGPHTQVSADPTDTWGHRVISYAWAGEEMATERIVLRESGPERARLRVERSWGRSTMTEEFILRQGADEVEVRVTIDWREQAHLLKLRFPVALDDPEATYEIPFATLRRPVDGAEEPGQSWVDLSSAGAGLAVVNNAKHGYDVSPAADGVSPSIGITAVRSPVHSWHDPRLLDPDGFYSFQDQGIQRFSYLLVPHAGDWRTAGLTRRAAVLGSAPRAMLESFHDGSLPPEDSFAADGGGSVLITAVKGWEDGDASAPDLIVRAVETTGTAVAGARLALPFVERVIEPDFGPHQIRTFRVPRDPAAPIVEVDLLEWPVDGDPPTSGTDG
jgi:alpha-mannosidase